MTPRNTRPKKEVKSASKNSVKDVVLSEAGTEGMCDRRYLCLLRNSKSESNLNVYSIREIETLLYPPSGKE
jgi:hypothetical protein